jgi:hypothetical protein
MVVIGNAVKQSSGRVCTWIASGCAFAMTMLFVPLPDEEMVNLVATKPFLIPNF